MLWDKYVRGTKKMGNGNASSVALRTKGKLFDLRSVLRFVANGEKAEVEIIDRDQDHLESNSHFHPNFYGRDKNCLTN